MKFHLPLALLATLATAQDLTGLHACAAPCFIDGFNKSDCPNTSDLACLCASKKFIDGVKGCVKKTCDRKDQSATLEWAKNACKDAGVKLYSH